MKRSSQFLLGLLALSCPTAAWGQTGVPSWWVVPLPVPSLTRLQYHSFDANPLSVSTLGITYSGTGDYTDNGYVPSVPDDYSWSPDVTMGNAVTAPLNTSSVFYGDGEAMLLPTAGDSFTKVMGNTPNPENLKQFFVEIVWKPVSSFNNSSPTLTVTAPTGGVAWNPPQPPGTGGPGTYPIGSGWYLTDWSGIISPQPASETFTITAPQPAYIDSAWIGTHCVTPIIDMEVKTNPPNPPANAGNQLKNDPPVTGPDQGIFTGPGAASSILNVGVGDGNYALAQVTDINNSAVGGLVGDAANYVEADGFRPGDEELDGFSVDVNGVLATQAQVDTLIAEANAIGGGLPADASLSDTAPLPDPFSSIYNLFLDVPNSPADKWISWNLSQTNDPNLVGYTITAVAVVPEPMSLGVLAFGGLGLMSRRHRKARF